MFRKIRNYLLILSISLIFFSNSALANPAVSEVKQENTVIDLSKGVNFFNGILLSGKKSVYTVKVEAGKKAKVVIHSSQKSVVKIQTPGGQDKVASPSSYFEMNLLAEGEYLIEVSSLFVSPYSLEAYNK